jgi:hypothetical protein
MKGRGAADFQIPDSIWEFIVATSRSHLVSSKSWDGIIVRVPRRTTSSEMTPAVGGTMAAKKFKVH